MEVASYYVSVFASEAGSYDFGVSSESNVKPTVLTMGTPMDFTLAQYQSHWFTVVRSAESVSEVCHLTYTHFTHKPHAKDFPSTNLTNAKRQGIRITRCINRRIRLNKRIHSSKKYCQRLSSCHIFSLNAIDAQTLYLLSLFSCVAGSFDCVDSTQRHRHILYFDLRQHNGDANPHLFVQPWLWIRFCCLSEW